MFYVGRARVRDATGGMERRMVLQKGVHARTRHQNAISIIILTEELPWMLHVHVLWSMVVADSSLKI